MKITRYLFISNYFVGPPSELLSFSAQVFRIFRSILLTKIGLKWSYGHGETFGTSRVYQALDIGENNRHLSTVAYKAVAYK